MAKQTHSETVILPRDRAVLVYTNTVPEEDAYVEEELRALADTAGVDVVAELRQRRDKPDVHTFLGEGKVEELLELAVRSRADMVVIDDSISPRQQHNLEEALKCSVEDRTQLILDIFARRAHTSEGALQVELAQHTYWLPRLMSRYTKFERQRGGTRTRGGAGEQQLEADRRKMYNRIATLKRQIEDLEQQRHQQREGRRRYPFPFAALVGYTSAGKSTLLNTLSGSEVYVDSRLFSTLDPTTRRVVLPGGYSVFITDTVGFIRNLPTQLVAAFKATLEEVTIADFLILIIDVSQPWWELQREAVFDTLKDLDAAGKPIVTVFNKIDLVGDHHRLVELVAETPNSVYVSASKATGINHLTDRLVATVRGLLRPVVVLIPYSESGLVSDCYEMGRVIDAEYLQEGIRVKAEVAQEMAGRLEPYRVE